MRKIRGKKSLLTLFSVLSVLLAFSLVCAGCLFVMERMGIVDFRLSERGGNTSSGEDFSLPVHTDPPRNSEVLPAGTPIFEKLLLSAPFSDSYYTKVRVTSAPASGNDIPVPGTYEIWRFGAMYKIHRYSDADAIERVVICDGSRVQVIDYTAMTNDYYTVSDGYTFEQTAPLPDFSFLAHEAYELFEYSETGGVCAAAYEIASLSTVENVKLSMETGMLLAFSRYHGGRAVWNIDVLSTDTDFIFRDYMFEID